MKIVGHIKDIITKLMQLDFNKLYSVEVKEAKSARSLRQNKMLWELIHKIAKAQNQDDMEVYCTLLERADALSDYIITATEMEDALRRTFRGVRFMKKQVVNDKECNIYKVYLRLVKNEYKGNDRAFRHNNSIMQRIRNTNFGGVTNDSNRLIK